MRLAPLALQSTGPDTDLSTSDTVRLMLPYSDEAQYQAPVMQATQQALAGCPDYAPTWRKAQAIHRWVTGHIQFVPDEVQLREMGYPDDWELLIPPCDLISWGKGDCDDFAMLTRSMLLAAGLSSAIETIAADPSTPWRWSHVYALVFTEDGSALAVDTAAAVQHPGYGLGWRAPHAFRAQEWIA